MTDINKLVQDDLRSKQSTRICLNPQSVTQALLTDLSLVIFLHLSAFSS